MRRVWFGPAVVLGFVFLVAGLAVTSAAPDEATVCNNTRATALFGTFGQIVVPAGAQCFIGSPFGQDTVHVVGDILVGDSAVFRVFAPAIIEGDIIASGHLSVNVGGSLVGRSVVVEGDVQLDRQAPDPDGSTALSSVRPGTQVYGNIEVNRGFGRLAIFGAEVWGNVDVRKNTVYLAITGNVLHRNVSVSKNDLDVGPPLGVRGIIADNVIDGNLECTGNDPELTNILEGESVPAPNVVAGHAEGQCAGL